jgi:cyclic pyranopterin phosphate synthase
MEPVPESRMVDIGDKPVTLRKATARGNVIMQPATFDALVSGNLPKGEALSVARIAGINGAKETSRLVPMCHPLLIDDVTIEFKQDKKTSSIDITASVKGSGKTGYEMEAMTAVAVSALTIYDLCKSLDSSVRIENIRLIRKSGGKSGTVVLEE